MFFVLVLGILAFGFSSHVLYVFAFPVAISDIVACAEEQILTDNNQPEMDDCPGGDNLDDEGEAMVEEALSGTLSKVLHSNSHSFS